MLFAYFGERRVQSEEGTCVGDGQLSAPGCTSVGEDVNQITSLQAVFGITESGENLLPSKRTFMTSEH